MTHSPHYSRWLFMLLLACLSGAAVAESKINTSFFGNLAIEGYDPVAYFTEDRPVEGSKQFTYQWMDAKWLFASQGNLDLFKENPVKYAPQYGGYCAYAISQNKFAGIDPTQFTVFNDRLYLNYNKKINKKWLANKEDYIVDADRNWPQLIK